MDEESLRRVLLVEDDADVRFVAAMALRRVGGLEVLDCASGREALERWSAFAPQAVLLDVMMPDMDGPTLCAQALGNPDLGPAAVIFVTAKVLPEELARYRLLGAAGVVAKPFDPMELPGRVREIWERWRREGGGRGR